MAEPMEVDETQPADGAAPRAPAWAVLNVDTSTAQSQIDAFLAQFPPSRCTSADVAWISVDRRDQPMEEGDPDTMASEWQWLCRRGAASAAELDRLARVYGVVSGKWMVFCPTAQIDGVWEGIARAVVAGRLGPSAKVSPRERGRDSCDHVVCVYVASYVDQEAVRRVRHGLRQLGHVRTLLFKPDAYTDCGIYKNNPWGIPPHMFSE